MFLQMIAFKAAFGEFDAGELVQSSSKIGSDAPTTINLIHD